MATPKQVYASDMYRQAAQASEPVPAAWFRDVYEALGESLGDPEHRNEKKIEAEKTDFLDQFLTGPDLQSPREQLLDDLAWLLEQEVPDDPYLYKPWERALDSISQGVRKRLGKKQFGEECAELVHEAINRLAGKRGAYPLKNATSPTRPVIELVLSELANTQRQADANSTEGRKRKYTSDLEAAELSQAHREISREKIEETPADLLWFDALLQLGLQMTSATHELLFRGSHLVSLDPPVVAVRDDGVRQMCERHERSVAEALGVEAVAFVVEGGDDD